MSGFPVTGVPGVPGGTATLSSTGSVLSAIASGSTGVGVGSLSGPDTSGVSTAVGYQAGKVNTTGWITAIGYQALLTNTTGGTTDELSNTAVGIHALKLNVVGGSNTAVGGAALFNNLASNNVAVGGMALEQNTTGADNTGVGLSAGMQNQTGPGNTALGYQALSGVSGQSPQYNTAVGYQCMLGITTGQQNCGLGTGTFQSLTSGNNNVAMGASAGQLGANTAGNATVSGSNNVWIGPYSGPGSNADPSYCTAVGRFTTCIVAGGVAIGVDHAGTGAAATLQDQIMLGTANHTVYEAATNTASGATYSNPSIANGATGAQVNATKDAMLYLTCSLAGTGLTIKLGPTSTPTNIIVNNVVTAIGDCYAIRVPGGWYVSWQATTATFANQAAVTC